MTRNTDRLDMSVAFQPVNIAVMTVSDSRTPEDDRSGDLLASRIAEDGHVLADRGIITDDVPKIVAQLRAWIDDSDIDVVIATGGTGLTGRDSTPEAFAQIVEKDIPGFGELFRYLSFAKIGTSTVQSRAMAGVAGGTYLFALPDRLPDAATGGTTSFATSSTSATVLQFVEIMPRLTDPRRFAGPADAGPVDRIGFAGPVIGVDEAGRGPWAGPVTVAACWLDPEAIPHLPPGLDDSKKLSAPRRAAFHAVLTGAPHRHAVVSVPVAHIDRDGILQATLDGMARAAETLAEDLLAAGYGDVAQLLIDGNQMPPTGLPAQTVVKGDSRSLSIAAASVIAKHERDSIMGQLAKSYPGYGWETNMGYGTRTHRQGLARLGVTAHHRRSFAPVRKALGGDSG